MKIEIITINLTDDREINLTGDERLMVSLSTDTYQVEKLRRAILTKLADGEQWSSAVAVITP